MNALHIHKGMEYAVVDYPSKNKRYYPGASRARILHVYKVEDEWSKRKSTLVEIQLLDKETGERKEGDHNIRTIGARQVVATWAEHLEEAMIHRQKEHERQEELTKRREERERREAEQQRLYEERNNRIYEELESIGIPRSMVTIRSYEVVISRHRLEEVLTNHRGESVRSKSDQDATASTG